MRILAINHRDWLNPRAGGVEEVLYQTTTRWSAAGHQVELLVSGFSGASERELTVDGVRIHRYGREEYFNWIAPGLVRRHFGNVDVIVEHLSKVACLLPRHVRMPVVGYVHHLFGRSLFGVFAWPLAAYVVGMEKLAIKTYRRCPFIVVSEATAQDLADGGINHDQIHVVHNGVDHQLFRPTPCAQKTPHPSVLWVGRIRKTKCVDHVVEAFTRFAAELPDAHLTIVGKGDFEPELRRMIAARQLQSQVTLTGYLDEQHLAEQMQQAWVLAYPSPKEGWGLCVTEAAACGTPAVASDSPGLRESVRHCTTGFLVPHGDIGALAEKIKLVLTDESLRRRLESAAVDWAGKFNWDNTAARSLEILQRAAKSDGL